MTKNGSIFLIMLISSAVLLSGCDVVVGIFEAGFWTAIIIVVILVVLVGYIIKKMRG